MGIWTGFLKTFHLPPKRLPQLDQISLSGGGGGGGVTLNTGTDPQQLRGDERGVQCPTYTCTIS